MWGKGGWFQVGHRGKGKERTSNWTNMKRKGGKRRFNVRRWEGNRGIEKGPLISPEHLFSGNRGQLGGKKKRMNDQPRKQRLWEGKEATSSLS